MRHSKNYAYNMDYIYCKGKWKESVCSFKGIWSRKLINEARENKERGKP